MQEEVSSVLKESDDFIAGPIDLAAPLKPGRSQSHEHTFLVEDSHYVSARFWGDAYALGWRFAKKLNDYERKSRA